MTHKQYHWMILDLGWLAFVSAARFEQGDYNGCREDCLMAVEIGREHRADFKMIAK